MKKQSSMCLFYCSSSMMRWILPSVLFFVAYSIHFSNFWAVSYLAKRFCFFPPPVFHIFLYRGLITAILLQAGRNSKLCLQAFCRLSATDEEEKKIWSHLDDYLQCFLKSGFGFPCSEATTNLLPFISEEQFIIVKAEGGVHIVFEVFKSLSTLALLKSKNLQRIMNCWAHFVLFHMWM